MSSTSRGHALLWAFVLSGFSGLVYQSIWTQYLGLFLGHSSHAQSLVLMLFMGGMALGAWAVSRRSERLTRPLLVYAAIELIIGLAGLLFDPIYHGLTQWAYETGFPLAASRGLASPVRWLLAVVIVLPQCILLGATFPLMSAGFMRLRPASEGRVLSGLYFANSIGAAIGAMAATYLLLPTIGLPGAIFTAGLLNIAVAIAIYSLSKAEIGARALAASPTSAGSVRGLGLVLAVAALTGLTSFVYEITWIRMLSLALGSTLHTFELMLAAFIAGIAFGGLWLRKRADRLALPLRMAGKVQLLMGLAALASLYVYANAFEWVGWLMRVLTRTAEGYVSFNIASGVIAALVMFPAAFFAGMTLPLLTLVLLRRGAGERAIGRVYAVNTLGAIAGVLLAIHVLLPAVGVKFSLWTAASVDIALGLVLLAAVRREEMDGVTGRPRNASLVAIASFCVASLIGSAFLRFDPLMMASSVFRYGAPLLVDADMLYYRDGKTATVAVYEINHGGQRARSISTNGKVDAAMTMSDHAKATPDEYTMTLLAALPLSMRSSYERVGVIGFGSGMTTHTLLGSRRVGRVDTVEIEPYMVEGARQFGARNRRAFEDPRSRVIVDDAKAYFAASGVRYDLIVSEPSNPWVGGTASLFTDEFYSFVPRHLNSDGLFVQWVQLYEISPELVSSILRAMLGHFSDVQAYVSNAGDLILVAKPRGRVPALGTYALDQPLLGAELARLGLRNVRDLQDGFVMDRRGLEVYSAINPSQTNSDFYPYLQLNAPASRFKRDVVRNFDNILIAPWPLTKALGGAPARPLEESLPPVRRPASYDKKLNAARDLYHMLTAVEPVDRGVAANIDVLQADALRGMASACHLDRVPARSISMMLSLAMETVPFLDEQANASLWGRPQWIRCPPKDLAVRDALTLIAASGQDDPVAVLRAGQAFLDGPGGEVVKEDEPSMFYVWGSMQTALVRVGEPALARQVQRRYGARIPERIRQNAMIRFASASALVRPGERLLGQPAID